MSPDKEKLLQAVMEARAEYEERLDDVQAARDEYYRLVQRLSAAGMPLREIAGELGLSHQRVHQMISEAPEKAKRKAKVLRRATTGLLLVLVASYAAIVNPFDRTSDNLPTAEGPRPTTVASAEVEDAEAKKPSSGPLKGPNIEIIVQRHPLCLVTEPRPGHLEVSVRPRAHDLDSIESAARSSLEIALREVRCAATMELNFHGENQVRWKDGA